MLMAHLCQQPATQDARVAQWSPGPRVALLSESGCRHLLPKWVESFITSLLWACSISSQLLVHPETRAYAEGLPSGAPFPEAPPRLPPCGWACPPAPRSGLQQSSLGGPPCRGAAFGPCTGEPPLRPGVPARRPPTAADRTGKA